MTDAVQLAIVAGLTTLGTALVTCVQTIVLEVIRRRRTSQAHNDIADKVANRLGPPFSDDRNATPPPEIKG